MNRFKGILITALLVVALTFVFSFSFVSAENSFYDVPTDPVYSPHINELFENNLITGYTNLNGESTGEYGSNHTIERSAFAKISAIVRLAELYGNQESWQNMDKDELTLALEDKLKYYHRCINDIPNCSTTYGADMQNVCNVCTSIGGAAFPDVKEDKEDCQSEGMCSWYAKYVYYSARKGTVKGYTNYDPPLYKPSENIKRIHALKMIIVDDGNISPENDPRYIRLSSLANSNNSYTPKCIKGAENYIRDNNGGDTEDAEKLLKYAILADRLDLFGNNCQVITNAGLNKDNPLEVAYFLQRPVLRKEIPRYLSITTSYVPIEPDPVTDTTINTPEENANSETIADEPYEIPVFVDPTPDGDEDTYNLFTEESSTEVILEGNTRIIIDTETGNYVVQDIATGTILETGTVEEGTTAEELAETIDTTALQQVVQEATQQTEQNETTQQNQQIQQDYTDPYSTETSTDTYTDPSEYPVSNYTISINHDLECNGIIIRAGKSFETYAVTKQGNTFVQGVGYGDYSCTVSCDILDTPECRLAIEQEEKELESRIISNMDYFYGKGNSPVETCAWAYKDDNGKIKPQSTLQHVLEWCNEHGVSKTEIEEVIKIQMIHDVLDTYVSYGNTPKETCDTALKATVGNEIYQKAVKEWCEDNANPPINYWYTVIPYWNTVKPDNNWGGVFSERIYDEKYRTDKLFPVKKGGKYEELVVQVVGSSKEYDNTDSNASANKNMMIANYRTTRWYKIKYTNPADSKPRIQKTGWVPVSGLVLKDDMFKITIDGLYIYDYYNTIHNRGYWNTSKSNISKVLLHNTGGSSAVSLIRGINSPPHYYFGREHQNDKNAGMDNRFAGYVPEYLNSGTVNSTGSDIEKKSISIEMVNWEWLNPLNEKMVNDMDNKCIKSRVCSAEMTNWECDKYIRNCKSPTIRTKVVNSGKFCSDDDSDKANNCFDDERIMNYTKITGDDYKKVQSYFNDNNGFFEMLNINDNYLTKNGNSWKGEVGDRKKVFYDFYEKKLHEDVYILKPKYLNIINSESGINGEFNELYNILNKIPFNYSFYNYYTYKNEIHTVVTPAGTYPFDVYNLNNASKAQALSDGKISNYYEKYTNEQYKNLNKFIDHTSEKYGIPKTTFKYNFSDGTPQKYGFYMYNTAITWDNMKKKVLNSQEGIVSHRNVQSGGKMCPAPGFQIDRLPALNN